MFKINVFKKINSRNNHYRKSDKMDLIDLFLKEHSSTGVSMSAFAKNNGIPSNTFAYWLKHCPEKETLLNSDNKANSFVHIDKQNNLDVENNSHSNTITLKYHEVEMIVNLCSLNKVLEVIDRLSQKYN